MIYSLTLRFSVAIVACTFLASYLTPLFSLLVLPTIKRSIAEAFPNGVYSIVVMLENMPFLHCIDKRLVIFYVGLPYVNPQPLLHTGGLKWGLPTSTRPA